MAKATDMAIPLYPKALENADYVVLTTLLDKKFSTFDTKNKPNFRKINRCDYLANKEEMIKATGDLNGDKKPLSKSQWDKHFKKLRELGVVEELRNTNNKLYAYRIYNKTFSEDGKHKDFTLVDAEIIRTLRKTYKSTPIKVYAFLRGQCWDYKNEKFIRKKINIIDICKGIGLTESSREDISKILGELHASKYIKQHAKTKKSTQGEYNILYYEYEIVSYEEWKKARKPFYF